MLNVVVLAKNCAGYKGSAPLSVLLPQGVLWETMIRHDVVTSRGIQSSSLGPFPGFLPTDAPGAAPDRLRASRSPSKDARMPAPRLFPFVFMALTVAWIPCAFSQDVDVRAEFVRLHAADDTEAVRALWEASPGQILVTIDEDLEGSLSVWEAAQGGELRDADLNAIEQQHQRALWGARLATEVTNRAIFIDYTSSFVGWSEEEKRSFREGQAAFGRARKALAAEEWDAALLAGQECTDLALPLGDWWGAAMGLSAQARALLGEGKTAAALVPASRARLLYQQLGLTGSELGAVETMLTALEALGRRERALACAEAAVSLASGLADAEAVGAFTARRDALK